ncbi:2-oxoadipate dioxygenase/decarboxylase family protein [Litorivivens sp.]|uniref:2-oxoadipate dioxygenase/decarboxylase family protein n=1 Tax=Litorivivens sp. TaxID=2020868 RepID=UPI00356542CA
MLSNCNAMLCACLGERDANNLMAMVEHPAFSDDAACQRGEIAHSLNLLLLADLLERVPLAAMYVAERCAAGERLFLDHGAVRSIVGAAVGLPAGRRHFARLLEPLGYYQNSVYPLKRLKMTGYSYTHRDYPEEIGQFFVSELDICQFDGTFQAAAHAVFDSACDPLSECSRQLLNKLSVNNSLTLSEAQRLLPQLMACFRRLHALPGRTHYETLKMYSAEAAWIATEGSAYNHVTDRIDSVDAFSDLAHKRGLPIKEKVEVSAQGSVRQTAFRAANVMRPLLNDDGLAELVPVPGAFFEFISRDRLADGSLDLRFDASNAQGIFKMTDSAA